eukprot:363163-Chlamydomonas_euryale.AAC.3
MSGPSQRNVKGVAICMGCTAWHGMHKKWTRWGTLSCWLSPGASDSPAAVPCNVVIQASRVGALHYAEGRSRGQLVLFLH